MEQSYKEKYEDILARLERAKNDNDVCDERFCCVIDEIIPELAESEDEKVRKEIINYFRCQSEEEPTRKEIHNKWIAWLGKQKGNIGGISPNWSEEDKQHIRTIIHAIHGAGNITPIDGELAEDWLKSLRPQK